VYYFDFDIWGLSSQQTMDREKAFNELRDVCFIYCGWKLLIQNAFLEILAMNQTI